MKHKIKLGSIEMECKCPNDCEGVANVFATARTIIEDAAAPVCDKCGDEMSIIATRIETPRAIMFVEGGVVHDIMADAPLQLRIIDYDIEGVEDSQVDYIHLVEADNKLSPDRCECVVLKHDLKGIEDLTPFFNQDSIA